MLRYLLASALLFSVLLYFIPVYKIPLAPVLVYAYQFNPVTNKQSLPAKELVQKEKFPFFAIKHRDKNDHLIISGPSIQQKINSQKNDLYVVPFLGKGYFHYQKTGKQIKFYSQTNELLWFKPYYSYPASDSTGSSLLLLTGDSNRVDIIDQNGTKAPVASISGNFMVHYFFDHSGKNKVVAFSNGQIVYIHDNQYKHIIQIKSDKQMLFVKSCTLSADGRLLAVHYLDHDKDKISVYSVTKTEEDPQTVSSNKLDEFDLPTVYPHLLHMSINDGGVLIAAPDQTLYYGLDGGPDWSRLLPSSSNKYRPVFSTRSFFIYGEHNTAKVLNQEGIKIYSIPLHTRDKNWRILPTRSQNGFAIQTREFIEMWLLKDQI